MTLRQRSLALVAGLSLALGACTESSTATTAARGPSASDLATTAATSPRSQTSSTPAQPRNSGTPPTSAELVGTWRPLTLAGRDSRLVRRVNGHRLTLTFTVRSGRLEYSAYDGCNWSSGRARLLPSGELSAPEPITSTLRLCPRDRDRYVSNVEAVTRASRVLLDGSRLRFYDPAGNVLGEYRTTHPGL